MACGSCSEWGEMYNHEPTEYRCPFCEYIRRDDTPRAPVGSIVHQAGLATAFLAKSRFSRIPVNVLVVPNDHVENLYDLDARYAADLHRMTRAIALALKGVYGCDGVSTRQHNEPAGLQDVWHYHVHVTPRFPGDRLYAMQFTDFPKAERAREAALLRAWIADQAAHVLQDA